MKLRVLVVDDNENNLMLEQDLLELAGFEVFGAGNAADAITIARRERPDVIAMDIRLPDMRGSEAARILRQGEGTCDIPIVFVTSSVMPAGREELTGIANSEFIGKPINTRTFAEQIRRFCVRDGEQVERSHDK
ncbi:response regulator [Candidatus Bipolaricaulota bacterium]|nr:response regulator [Candidatus Bipolaricaulota bacterium]